MSVPILSISIGIDPDMFNLGSFTLTWHGFFTMVAVAMAVYLVTRWSRGAGLNTDAVMSVAFWCVVAGIIGSRALHVIDLWGEFYKHDPIRIVEIWQGGITVYGGVLGGFLGGAGYILIRNHPRFLCVWNRLFTLPRQRKFLLSNLSLETKARVELREALSKISPVRSMENPEGSGRGGSLEVVFLKPVREEEVRAVLDASGYAETAIHGGKLERAPLPAIGRLADLSAPAVVLAMAVGRIGDIINGEHVAKLSELPWTFVYTHSESPSNAVYAIQSSHPAVVYEMLWDLVVLGMLVALRNRLRPFGMLFVFFLGAYSVGKFFVSFLRVGSIPGMDREVVLGLGEAHFVAIAVLLLTVPLLLAKAQWVRLPGRSQTGRSGARQSRAAR